MATQVITSTSRQSSYKRASSSLLSKTEKMSFSEKDEDNWKNYQDYPDGFDPMKEDKQKEEIKKIIIAASIMVVLIPTGIIAIKKRLAIKVMLANWIQSIIRFFESITSRIRNIRQVPATLELSVIHPSQISIPLSSLPTVPTPPPPRYLTDRPIVMIDDREASERRLREVSAVLNQYFERPLPQFAYNSNVSESAFNLSTAESENRISTPIEHETFTVREDDTISVQSLDPAGLLSPLPIAPNNTLMEITVSNSSVGSVMAIQDIPAVRQQPTRATRNKVPIYKDPSENDDEN